MKTSEDIQELIKALHKFQGEVGNLSRSGSNPFFKSDYAPINEVLKVINKPLQDNELCFVQFPTGKHGLTTRIMHTSGQWMEDTFEIEPTKNDPQGQGSAITYNRRYSLVAILGLNDGDDDGNEGSKQPSSTTLQPQKATSQPSKPQTGGKCQDCSKDVSEAEKGYSEKNYNKTLCRACQGKYKKV